MGIDQNNQESETFTNNPLAPLFFEYVDILRSHHFHKEADNLITASEQYHLPENKIIVIKIVMEMQKVAVLEAQDKLDIITEQYRVVTKDNKPEFYNLCADVPNKIGVLS